MQSIKPFGDQSNKGKYYYAQFIDEKRNILIQEKGENKEYKTFCETQVLQGYISQIAYETRKFRKGGVEKEALSFKLVLKATDDEGQPVYTVMNQFFSNRIRSMICTLMSIKDPINTPIRIVFFEGINNKTGETEPVLVIYNALTNGLLRRDEERNLGEIAKKMVEVTKNKKGEVISKDYDELNKHLCDAIDMMKGWMTTDTVSNDDGLEEILASTKDEQEQEVDPLSDLPF